MTGSMNEKKIEEDIGPLKFLSLVNKDALKAFTELKSKIREEGALSSREKLLIALACSAAVKCEPCMERHIEEASKAGISIEEISEAVAVAGLVCCSSSFAFAGKFLEGMKE